MHRQTSLINPFPEFADVIVVIQNHLKITMSVVKTEKLCGTLAGKNVRGFHLERADLVKHIENGIRQIQANEVPIRIYLLHLPPKVRYVVFWSASFIMRINGGAEIIHDEKAATIEILSKVDHVLRGQLEESRFAQIRKRILE